VRAYLLLLSTDGRVFGSGLNATATTARRAGRAGAQRGGRRGCGVDGGKRSGRPRPPSAAAPAREAGVYRDYHYSNTEAMLVRAKRRVYDQRPPSDVALNGARRGAADEHNYYG
jgi:hypothetical protein